MFTPGSSVPAYILAAMDLVVCLIASAHVLLYKRDTRAATGWIGLIWLSPVVGAALYLLLGINRISRKARALRRDQSRPAGPPTELGIEQDLRGDTRPRGLHLATLSHVVDQVARFAAPRRKRRGAARRR